MRFLKGKLSAAIAILVISGSIFANQFNMAKIDKLITEFLEDLEVARGRSQKTIRNYDFYLRRFSGWLKENGVSDAEDVTQEQVHKYRLWLNRLKDPIRKTTLKKNTPNRHLAILKRAL